MAIRVQCPSPACGAACTGADKINGRNVKCPKCGLTFIAHATLDGQGDTKRNGRIAIENPFPSLPAEFGRYRVLRLLGQGGMGAVYLATDSQLGRDVALKIPFFGVSDGNRAERFIREAQSAAVLKHPNICTVYDAGTINGRPFITMEYIPGSSLDSEIDPDSPMPERRVAEIVRKVAVAIDHAHKKGTVHRDLKPANVVMTADGEPVVMDFGLAMRIGGADHAGVNQPKLTHDGGVLGTPSYMSPEQLKGVGVGPSSDIYSLGVVMFELLTGQTPYTGSFIAIASQILSGPVPTVRGLLANIDPRLEEICRKAMSREVTSRFPNMSEMAKALDQYLNPPVMSAEVISAVALPGVTPRTVPSDPESASAFSEIDVPSRPRRRNTNKNRRLVGIAISIVALIGVAWLANVVLRVETSNGTLIVEISDPEIEARIKDGKVILTGADGKTRYTLAPSDREKKITAGAYGIRVEGADGLTLDTSQFTLKKGGIVTVRVSATSKAVANSAPSTLESNTEKVASKTAPRPVGPPSSEPGTLNGTNEKTESFDWKGEQRTRIVRTLKCGNTTMDFVKIPKGGFLMGLKNDSARPSEGTSQHRVTFTKDLWVAKYPVTLGQFREFVSLENYLSAYEAKSLAANGYDRTSKKFVYRKLDYSWKSVGWLQTDRHPVVNVTWDDAVAFGKWLSKDTKMSLRLLTEPEYEYANRGGQETRYFTGDDPSSTEGYANMADQSALKAWSSPGASSHDDGEPFTSPVGKFKANPFGLYDMTGNVWCWCADEYRASLNTLGDVTDPTVIHGSPRSERAMRGGSFYSSRDWCKVGDRMGRPHDMANADFGFRLCFSSEPE
ncbi:bifunctional serine/threonine-protein kinase/formylglycine-generating enzyme family protein [Limnoglobus roseus]|uniref:Serine/threonine protein kinase n=1 Tax=Limnoglobus roseus TaxID=2598579 RepID=A0A5C1A759_9BACT|nr:bifunctional serine/threonine-protein kinase/formylglycine-generating enzyme family protein [Limnoglobus roseus]QEL15099.1 serine/threonine protein kinase [Limnoglobus roseus]